MTPLYWPGGPFPSAFGEFLTTPDPERFMREYRYDISPVSDNNPFFFYTVQPGDLLAFLRESYKFSADYKINRAVPVLFGLVGVSLLATVITLALPPLVLGARLPSEKGLRRFLLYFVAIGTGYIFIQVALIQKFVLFLGHPTYALTVIIFSMLLSSGLGSFYSRRALTGSKDRWMRALALVAMLVVLLALSVGPIIAWGVGWPLAVKAPISVLLIVPAGFVMGMPFPTGLTYLERRSANSVRWAWSLNAASSVLGSAFSMFFALYLGLEQTLILGGLMYLLALWILQMETRAEVTAAAK